MTRVSKRSQAALAELKATGVTIKRGYCYRCGNTSLTVHETRGPVQGQGFTHHYYCSPCLETLRKIYSA